MKETSINEASTISFGLLLVLLGSIAGGVFYVATMTSQQSTFKERLDRIETKQEEYNRNVEAMRSDLQEIKGYLKGKGK